MRKSLKTWMRFLVVGALAMAIATPAAARKGKHPTDLTQILSQMNEASKHLNTVSANLDLTKVTVLVDDKSTESGQLYFRKGKPPEIRIDFEKPERKFLLFKKNHGEIFLPKINQIQEYDLGQKSDLLQQFLLVGFGTETSDLKKAYVVKYLREEDMDDDTTVLLELVPNKASIAAHVAKIQIWVSEESWLPTQQKIFESGGDYTIARYSSVKVNRGVTNSTFVLNAPDNAKRVPMN